MQKKAFRKTLKLWVDKINMDVNELDVKVSNGGFLEPVMNLTVPYSVGDFPCGLGKCSFLKDSAP
jgi:hypothetical protein